MKKGILLIKVILVVLSICFIACLWIIFGELYGKIESIQRLVMTVLLFILIACLISDKRTEIIKKLSDKETKLYFSSAIQLLIGFGGVIAVVLSVLYGAYINAPLSIEEYNKLLVQIQIWFGFTVYFVFIMGALFIYPLMKRLRSIQ